ncbi:NAD(P)/FAD-dependent oxidoreductase [Robiginitalea sediminis]|uniref:NAD(P)/FAD-dependent oxidoreductase n=1 Tax=Robiginitalea sediminis TaxID=1982593 RepID=UPI000B4ADBEA|nr:FAD-dependent oxidoreductase [Robiginitalea sediminis]
MHVVIIGNGIAGVTAARHIRKLSDARITLISAETDSFFSRTALMYIYMGHLTFDQTKPYEESFWGKNRIDRVRGYVQQVLPEQKSLELADGRTMGYDTLILATGSRPNKFGWPGQDLDGVQGLYSYQDLELLERYAPDNKTCHRAVIVGGGLIGIELAEMLRSREIPVTFLVRESSFWNGVLPKGESEMINEHIREHHIDLRLGTNLKEILADASGRARAVVTDTGETIDCNLVGLTAGVSPNIGFLKGSGIELDKGVLVSRYLETNIRDVYAIGDCAQQREPIGRRRPVEAVWYTGRMMGETVAQTICGNRREYAPGHWFNSAKFLDIEYQTYGWVFPERSRGEEEQHFHWRHPKDLVCLTLAYNGSSGLFLGLNTFGMRMRHEVLDRWLREGRSATHVVAHLREALFDPELYRHPVAQIQAAYQLQNQPVS